MTPLQQALARLLARDPAWRRALPPADPLGAVARARGVALSTEQQGGGSAFAEADASKREYWAARTLTTTDGLFTFEVEPIKSILLVSGDRATFADPPKPGGGTP